MSPLPNHTALLEALVNDSITDAQASELRSLFSEEEVQAVINGNAAMKNMMIAVTQRRIDELEDVARAVDISAKLIASSERKKQQFRLAKRVFVLGLSLVAIAIVALVVFAPEWITSFDATEKLDILPLTAAGMIGFALLIAVLLEWRS